MDTKWKKSKAVIGMASYVLGISMLLSVLLFNPYVLFHDVRADISVILSPGGRYEQTQDFRNYVSRMADNLLRIGAGKPLSDAIYEYGYSGQGWFPEFFGSSVTTQATVVSDAAEAAEKTGEVSEEEIVREEAVAGGDSAESVRGGFWEKEEEDEWSRQELQEMYERFFERHLEDKNLLYQLSYTDKDGKKHSYNNAEPESFGGEENILPEGYGFLLRFDRDRAFAWLEGEELDLYGDGIYRWDGTQWELPGYDNYRLNGDFARSQVTIAARRVPMRYAVDGTVYGGSLYWAQHSFAARKRAFGIWLSALLMSIACLAVSFWLRKERRETVKKLGRALGKIYVEGVLLFAVALLWGIFDCFIRPVFWWGNRMSWVMIWIGILVCFWSFCLLYLYLRNLSKPWKRSLLGKLVSFLWKKEQTLEIQDKISNRLFREITCLAVGVITALVGMLLPWRAAVACRFVSGAVLLAGVAFACYNIFRQYRLSLDLGLLNDQINAAWEGKAYAAGKLPSDSDLAKMGHKVAGIRDGLETAVEERMKSERMKVELVANVSHDIKTPLTSIVSYVDLLKEDDRLPEELQDYVAILSQKSERLKEMVQDVFEVSKASSGQLPVSRQRLDLAKLLRQTIADMQEQIENAPVNFRTQIPEGAVEIVADGQRLYRVFQNLLQNALQYSLEGSRVYVRLEKEGSLAVASVQNTSRNELEGGVDFTERFVRGDQSRTDGGSGLGLSIAKSFTEACGGTFAVETIADLFVVTVGFETA